MNKRENLIKILSKQIPVYTIHALFVWNIRNGFFEFNDFFFFPRRKVSNSTTYFIWEQISKFKHILSIPLNIVLILKTKIINYWPITNYIIRTELYEPYYSCYTEKIIDPISNMERLDKRTINQSVRITFLAGFQLFCNHIIVIVYHKTNGFRNRTVIMDSGCTSISKHSVIFT